MRAYGLRNPYRLSFDMVNGFLYTGEVGLTNPYIIFPRQPGRSTLWERVRTLDSQFRMSPIATTRLHQEAVDLLAAWIDKVESPAAASHWRVLK